MGHPKLRRVKDQKLRAKIAEMRHRGSLEEVLGSRNAEEMHDPTGKDVNQRVATCPAFFIGADESDADCCASFFDDDESDAESCHHFSGDVPLETAYDALSTSGSSGGEGSSHEDGPKMQKKQLELSDLQCSAICNEDALDLRKELRNLADALDGERCERLAAFKSVEAVAGQLASDLGKEVSERSADFARLTDDFRRSSTVGLEATRSCITRIDGLERALEDEAEARAEMQVFLGQAFKSLRAEFKREVAQQTNLCKDLNHRLGADLSKLKERCVEQDKFACHVKDVLDGTERKEQV